MTRTNGTTTAYEVDDRIYWLGAEVVNWFAVEDRGKLTVVDAGNPNQYEQLPLLLAKLGYNLTDVAAVLLTRAHGDHLGSAARIRQNSGAGVYVHHGDAALARGESHRAYERHFIRDMYQGYAWKRMLFFLRGGATKAPRFHELSEFEHGESLDIPGRYSPVTPSSP